MLYLQLLNPTRWYYFKSYKTYAGAIQAYKSCFSSEDFKNMCQNVKLEIGIGKIRNGYDSSVSFIDHNSTN